MSTFEPRSFLLRYVLSYIFASCANQLPLARSQSHYTECECVVPLQCDKIPRSNSFHAAARIFNWRSCKQPRCVFVETMLCCNVRASCFRSKYSKKKCLLALFPKRIITCFCKLVAAFLRTSKIYLYIAFARGDRTFFSRCRVLMAVVRVSLYLATSSLRVVLRCIPTTLSATAATQFFPKQSLHPDAFLLSFSSLVLYPSPPSCLRGQSLSRHARGKPFL